MQYRKQFYKRLILVTAVLSLASAAIAATGSIMPNDKRHEHTATLLNDGTVLLAGGKYATNSVKTSEVYTPSTKLFTAVSDMTTARNDHSAVLLGDGKVLITGGTSVSGTTTTLGTAEVYNPTTKTFTATSGPMVKARTSHASVKLSDGRVLIVGGNNNGVAVTSAEIYNPTTSTFTQIVSLPGVHTSNIEAFWLAGGKVAVVGGGENRASVFDSTNDTFTMVSLKAAHSTQTSVLLPNGKILISDTITEVFDPGTGASVTIAGREGLHSSQRILGGAAAVLSNGKTMLAGGYYPDQGNKSAYYVDYFDYSSQTFSTDYGTGAVTLLTTQESGPSQFPGAEGRSGATATKLQDGNILVVGGMNKATSTATSIPNDEALLYDATKTKFFELSVLQPDLTITYAGSPGTMVFPSTSLGGYASIPITITSTSKYADLKITDARTTGAAPTAFQLDLTDCSTTYPVTVVEGTPCVGTALYIPSSSATETATMEITSNSVRMPTAQVSMSGPGGTITKYNLTLAKSGAGAASSSFTLSPSVAAVSGAYPYTAGTHVVITAVPAAGYETSAWAGCDSFSEDICNVSMTAAKTVTATFAAADTIAPTGIISLSDGTTTTASLSITLKSVASDNSGVVSSMQFSTNGGSTWGAWEDYATTKNLTLPAGDGPRTIEARFKDATGNMSTAAILNITVDTSKPAGTFSINGGAAFTATQLVYLTMASSNSGTITGYQTCTDTCTDATKWSAWGAFTTSQVAFMLPSGDGSKTVYINFRNASGTTSVAAVSQSIILDKTIPSGTVKINNGATSTTNPNVTLTLSATDNAGQIAKMQFAVDTGAYGAWQAYATQASVALPATNGTRTVSVKFQDAAGNISAIASATIQLNVTSGIYDAQIALNGGADYTKQLAITVTNTITGPNNPTQMRFSVDGGVTWPSTWSTYAASTTLTLPAGEGRKAVAGQFKNSYGEASATSTIVLDTTAPVGSFKINGGVTVTSDVDVSLSFAVTEANKMASYQTSTNNSTWSAWQYFNGLPVTYALASGDGSKIIYVKFQDAAGNISSVVSQVISLDTTAPVGSIKINNGAASTANPVVTVQPVVTDVGGALDLMQFAVDGNQWGSWLPYASSATVTLPAEGGSHTVYARFRDAAGNISSILTSVIQLNQVLADGAVTIKINGGAAYATTPTVTVVTTVSGTAPVTQMRYSVDGGITWPSTWEAYTSTKTFSVPAGDGLKTIAGQFRNSTSDTSASDTVVLDTAAPTGSFVINGGAATTSNEVIAVALSASDANPVTQYQSNTNGTWSGWSTYSTLPQQLTLPSTDGVKTVYVKFKDAAGNISASISKTIRLDKTAPSGSIKINNGAVTSTSPIVTVQVSATDNGGAVDSMQFMIDGGQWSSWQAYATSATITLPTVNGVRTIYARYKDAAGNISQPVSASIELAQMLTSGSVAIKLNAGAPYTNQLSVTVTATTSSASPTLMRYSVDGGITWPATWETYAATKTLALVAGDGQVAVVGQFKNSASSTSASSTIVLDTTVPTGSFAINNGAAATNSEIVTVALAALDAGLVSEFQSNTDGTWSIWRPYSTLPQQLSLPLTDGVKTVYVKFKDAAGNISPSVSKTIRLDKTAPAGTIKINGGATTSTDPTVTVQPLVADSGSAVAMAQYQIDSGAWGAWEAYAAQKAIDLPVSATAHVISARFKDAAGNISETMTAAIQVSPALTMNIKLNDAAEYTKTSAVTVKSWVTGPGVPTQMRFSGDGGVVWSAWEAYAASKAITLASGEGKKTLMAQFKDAATTAAAQASIIVDSVAPTASIKINNGAASTNSTTITLNFAATDLNGVVSLKTSLDGVNWTNWSPFVASASFAILSGDGKKTVYVRYLDKAGNVSAVASTNISLVTTVPTAALSINSGAVYVKVPGVSISLTPTAPGIVSMQFSNDNVTWGGWEPYASVKTYTLPAVDGARTVYARFKDATGAVSTTTSDSIILDTTRPAGYMIVEAGSTATNLQVKLSSADAGSGVDKMRFSYDGGVTWGNWEAFMENKAFTFAAPFTKVSVQFIDKAGNASVGYSVLADVTAPTGTLKLNGGAAYTNKQDVTASLTASDASGIVGMRTNLDNAGWGDWSTFAPSLSFNMAQGKHAVSVQYKDAFGNVSVVYAATIVVDTEAPSGSVTINNGALSTYLTAVQLSLTATDNSQVKTVSYSLNDGKWISAPYGSTVQVVLPAGAGSKMVSVQFYDAAGNASPVYTDTITLL